MPPSELLQAWFWRPPLPKSPSKLICCTSWGESILIQRTQFTNSLKYPSQTIKISNQLIRKIQGFTNLPKFKHISQLLYIRSYIYWHSGIAPNTRCILVQCFWGLIFSTVKNALNYMPFLLMSIICYLILRRRTHQLWKKKTLVGRLQGSTKWLLNYGTSYFLPAKNMHMQKDKPNEKRE